MPGSGKERTSAFLAVLGALMVAAAACTDGDARPAGTEDGATPRVLSSSDGGSASSSSGSAASSSSGSAASSSSGGAAPSSSGAAGLPSTTSPPSVGASVQQQVDEGRRTAIVRAASRVSPAVVSVNTVRTQRVRPRSLWEDFFVPPGAARRVPGLGSGVIYDAEGLVLTNEHVVRNADRIMVTLPDGRDFEAELLGADEVTDLAVLRIEGDDLPEAPIGTSEDLLIGEWTVAIGNPFGFVLSSARPTVTAGVVSALDRHILPSDERQGLYVGMIQTDAPINPGNSGGPLVNALGEVVGINTSILSRSGESVGLGFAIPVDRAVRIAFDLSSRGEVRRAWTGMDVEPVEADVWGRTRGVRVARVAPESPADRAGIEEGDRLLEGDGGRLANPFDYESLLLDHRAGDEVTFRIEGRNEPVTLETEPLPTVQAERVRVLEDLELVSVTPAVRSERDLQSDRGALVVSISSTLSRQLGLREGDVLLQINNAAVADAEDAARALRSVAGTGTVRVYFERNGSMSVRTFYWGR